MHEHMIADFRRRFWVSLVLTVPVLAFSPTFAKLVGANLLSGASSAPGLSAAIASVLFFYGGWPFLAGFVSELRSRSPGMMTLIAVAIFTAYAYSVAVVVGLKGEVFFWELATLVDVMLLGHWVEMRSVSGASRALEKLARLMPGEAHLVGEDGEVRDVPLSKLERGSRVLVKPGEKIPADGEVVEGATSVNESLLTGESRPVVKSLGDAVIGGSVNAEGSISIRVVATGGDSFLEQVIRLVNEAQQSKSRTQNLANRAARWLTFVALSVGAVTFVAWFYCADSSGEYALARTVTVMVIACPHALGLAIPLVIAVSTSLGARFGVLIRNRDAFEQARRIDTVVFDKTGTLTYGEFRVIDTISFLDEFDAEALLALAAAVEARSEHPIATGVVASVEMPGEASDVTALPGEGVRGRVHGRTVLVVSGRYLKRHGLEPPADQMDRLSHAGDTTAFVVVGDSLAGVLSLGDRVRAESHEAVSRLKAAGITPVMITGDGRQVATRVAEELGIDDYFAEVLPQDKSGHIDRLRAQGRIVAMTGDGVNDAPALAKADVGIAIGAGTDVAVETADVVLVRSDPRDVVNVIELSRATYTKMLQNLFWAAGYNVIAIPVAAGVLASLGIILGPAVGAALMSVSTVIVAINARLLTLRSTGP